MPFRTTNWDDIEAAGSGDERAWQRFYASYSAPLFFIVRKQSGFSDGACEEIAHDVLAEMFTNGLLAKAVAYKKAHPEERFGDYVFKRMLYAVHQRLRGRRAGEVSGIADEIATPAPDTGEFERIWAAQNVFLPAIRRLRNHYRRNGRDDEYHVFLDRYLSQRRPGSIAEGGKSAKGASQIAIRVREKLRTFIEERLRRQAAKEDADFELLMEDFMRIFANLGAEEFDNLTTQSYAMLLSDDYERVTTTGEIGA